MIKKKQTKKQKTLTTEEMSYPFNFFFFFIKTRFPVFSVELGASDHSTKGSCAFSTCIPFGDPHKDVCLK